MKRALLLLVILGCDSKDSKPAVKKTQTDMNAAKTPFQTNRVAACEAFADRIEPTMRAANTDPTDSVTTQCMTDQRITKDNYECLLAASTVDGLGACFKQAGGSTPSATFESDRKAACAAYSKHVLELMQAELRTTSIRMCMSARMTEAAYDCVMKASGDADFKKCLGQ